MSCVASGDGKRDGEFDGEEGFLLLPAGSAGAVTPASGAMDGVAANPAVVRERGCGAVTTSVDGLAASPAVEREGASVRVLAP